MMAAVMRTMAIELLTPILLYSNVPNEKDVIKYLIMNFVRMRGKNEEEKLATSV